MKLFRNILCLSLSVLLLNSCADDDIIPERKFAEIYAEMLLVDQWVVSKPGMRSVADTSLVYEPIFNKYGYTADDYRKSRDFYVEEPEDYVDVMSKTIKILQKRLKTLRKRQVDEELHEKFEKFVEQFYDEKDFILEEKFPYLADNEYSCPDSLTVETDSLTLAYKLVEQISSLDTIQVEKVVSDTTSVAKTGE